MGADALEAQIVADDGELLLDGPLRERENTIFALDIVAQAIILDILENDKGDCKHASLACFLLCQLQVISAAVVDDITGSQAQNITDPQAKVSFQHQGCRNPLIRAKEGRALLHGGNDFFVLIGSQSRCFLVHSFLQKRVVRFLWRNSSVYYGTCRNILKTLDFGVRIIGILRTLGSLRLLHRRDHLHTAIKTGDVDFLRGSDAHSAAGTDVFAAGAFLRNRGSNRRSAVGSSSSNLKTAEFISVDQNIGQVVIQNEFQKLIAG